MLSPFPARRWFAVGVLAVALVIGLGGYGLATSDARAGTRSGPGIAADHNRLVATVPSYKTPQIADGRVYAIAEVGDLVVVGGSFTGVTSKGGDTVLPRRYLFAFSKSTGVVDPGFVPALDGEVRALLPDPAAGTVYVAGKFRNVNGGARRGITLLRTGDGAQDGEFRPPAFDGYLTDLALHPNGRLLVGGTFTRIGTATRGGLASLNRTTGALGSYLAVKLAGHHNWDGDGAMSSVGVERFALSPDGARLVVIGNFTTADGQDRDQIVVVGTGTDTASVSSWQTESFTSTCNPNSFDSWVRDVAYAPDGSYFVVAATGGVYPGTLCDTASRWSGSATGAGQTPTWVAASGGDTLLSTAVTDTAVYVGGHFRWLNNPTGRDRAQPGAIGRASIAALDPATGLPYAWNPGRNPRGFGVTELYASSDGLWLGYDTDYLGNYQYPRSRIGFFPVAGGSPVPAADPAGLPGRIYLAAEGITSDVRVRQYDGPGEVSGSTPLASAGGTDWRTARGGFWLGGTLFYGASDGQLYRRSFDGETWGAATVVDPYHDNDGVAPDWDTVSNGSGGTFAGAYPDFYGTELATVTGMGYAGGRLYYTRAGSSALYWRWFTPSTGAVSAQRFQAAASGFGDVAGALFVVADQLYVSRIDGVLYRMPFAGGAPSGAQTAVSGPGVDGLSWRARAVFPGP